MIFPLEEAGKFTYTIWEEKEQGYVDIHIL